MSADDPAGPADAPRELASGRFEAVDGVLDRRTSVGLVLLTPAGANLSLRGPSAPFIWDAIGHARPMDQVVSELCEAFGADRATVAADVDAMLQALLDGGAIHRVEHASG